jgi:hypothetical protein
MKKPTALSALKLIHKAKPNTQLNPVQQRRHKLLERMQEQKALAQCLIDGTVFESFRNVRVEDKDTGERKTVNRLKRVKPWYYADATGNYFLEVKYGSIVLELAEGLNAIEVGSKDKLTTVLDTLIAATQAGDLDQLLEKATGVRKIDKTKVA